MARIYLDHAASSPLRPEAKEAMERAYLLYGNPSSLHADGRAAAELLEGCRDRVAKVFACRGNDVVFNSGGSEGDTHALLGSAELINTVRWGAKHHGVARQSLRIAVSAIEHKAVLHAAEKLKQCGHLVSLIPVSRNGVIDFGWVEEHVKKPGLDLVSVMAVNNEVGTIQPINEVAELCLGAGVIFHCDAVQVPGHGLTEVLQDSRIPLLCVSGHKFGGPRGTGVLIQRREILAQVLGLPAPAELPALICGGSQEHGCRAGTENVAGTAGLVVALELAESLAHSNTRENPASSNETPRCMRETLEKDLLQLFPDALIHGADAPRAPHICSIALPSLKAELVQAQLDRSGIAVGLGSACSSCDKMASHVLRAMQIPNAHADMTVRISLSASSSTEEIVSLLDYFAE